MFPLFDFYYALLVLLRCRHNKVILPFLRNVKPLHFPFSYCQTREFENGFDVFRHCWPIFSGHGFSATGGDFCFGPGALSGVLCATDSQRLSDRRCQCLNHTPCFRGSLRGTWEDCNKSSSKRVRNVLTKSNWCSSDHCLFFNLVLVYCKMHGVQHCLAVTSVFLCV